MERDDGLTRVKRKTILEIELPSGPNLEAESDGSVVRLVQVDDQGGVAEMLELDRVVLHALLQLIDESSATPRFEITGSGNGSRS
jgi:hypothetical protein